MKSLITVRILEHTTDFSLMNKLFSKTSLYRGLFTGGTVHVIKLFKIGEA